MDYLYFNPDLVKNSTFTENESRYLAKLGGGGISRMLYNIQLYGYKNALKVHARWFYREYEVKWAQDTVLKYQRYAEVYSQSKACVMPYYELTSFISSIDSLDCIGN